MPSKEPEIKNAIPNTPLPENSLEESQDANITRDDLYNALANERRRYILHYLKHADGTEFDIRTLVNNVASWEHNIDPQNLDTDQRKNTYTALRQLHLPKLDGWGLIEFDKDRGWIRTTGVLDEIELFDEPGGMSDDGVWPKLYLPVSVTGLGLVVAVWAGIPPFGVLSGTFIALLWVVLLGAVSVFHGYHKHQSANIDMRSGN